MASYCIPCSKKDKKVMAESLDYVFMHIYLHHIDEIMGSARCHAMIKGDVCTLCEDNLSYKDSREFINHCIFHHRNNLYAIIKLERFFT